MTNKKQYPSSDNIVMGLDIGAAKTYAVICEIDKENHIVFRGVGTSPTAGVEKGKVVDEESFFSSIKYAVERAIISAGVTPVRVITNVPLYRVVMIRNTGVVTASNASPITHDMIAEAVQKSKQVPKLANHTVLHAIPLEYRIDGRTHENPKGHHGTHLEVDTNIVLADAVMITTLKSCLAKIPLKIAGVLYDPLSMGYLLMTEKEREEGTLLLDISNQFTKCSLFYANKVVESHLLPVGNDQITSDISTCLKLSIHEAERLKIIHGNVCLEQVNPIASIQVSNRSERNKVEQQYLCRIMEARVHEILQLSSEGLDMSKVKQVVLSGEGGQVKGLVEYMGRFFKRPIRYGLPESLKNDSNQVTYAVALGCIMYAVSMGAIKFQKPNQPENFLRKLLSWA